MHGHVLRIPRTVASCKVDPAASPLMLAVLVVISYLLHRNPLDTEASHLGYGSVSSDT